MIVIWAGGVLIELISRVEAITLTLTMNPVLMRERYHLQPETG